MFGRSDRRGDDLPGAGETGGPRRKDDEFPRASETGFVADPGFSPLTSDFGLPPALRQATLGGLAYSDEKERGADGWRPGT